MFQKSSEKLDCSDGKEEREIKGKTKNKVV